MKKMIQCAAAAVVLLLIVTGAGLAVSRVPEREKDAGDSVSGVTVEDYGEPDLEDLKEHGLDAFETTLPVLYIDTGGHRITKENKIWASLAVLEASEDGRERSILEKPDGQAPITIKYRGASSYSQFDKMQYRIKFYKKEGSSKAKDYELLGMGSNSEWVLNGPFLDKTLLRNRLVYGLGREIFEWAPDSRYVELFVDGKYQGVYLAVEPVTNGESRLRLSEFGLLSGETPYIVKRDRVGTEEDPLEVYGKYSGKTNNDLYIEYPTSGRLTEEQRSWIEKDISAFEEVLYGDDFADPETGYAAYIDVDDFVDYVILNEVFMNYDAGNLSTYVYKELGGKLQIAIWDYNNCLDNYQWFAQDFSEFCMTGNAWFSRLLEDRSFVEKVVSRYGKLREGVLSQEHIYERIAAYQAELGDAVGRNFAVWGYSFGLNLLTGENRDLESYEEAMEQLYTALDLRFEFLDSHMKDLYANCVN